MRILSFWVLLVGLCWPWAALAEQNIDLRMVVETSAAMDAVDSENLRGQGLELFIRNLPNGARAGIWSVSRNVRQVVKHAAVDPLWRQVASIHAASLKSESTQVKLGQALAAATWDLGEAARGPVHLVLFASGDIRIGADADTHATLRRELLADWAAKLRRNRVVVHTLLLGDGGDADLMKQLADLSGGLHRKVVDAQGLREIVVDIQRRLTTTPEARPDDAGRFQVAPGAERFTVLWLASAADAPRPRLQAPDGQILTRLTPLPRGRWLRAHQFEMVSVEAPQPGWWQVLGPRPERIQILGEIGVTISGLDNPVVPSDDSSVEIRLFDRGEPIRSRAFLDLLDVRAWAIVDGKRLPLPLDVTEAGFEAFFVNLQDGAHQFEVEVIAPTFTRMVTVPFVVSNPLLVEIREDADGAAAWLQFTHAEVDYATVRTAALLRKPPQIATLIPGERMPAGLWRIPLDGREGIVEAVFSVSGNYLNGKGVFVKTKPHALKLPLTDGMVTLRYDAEGRLLSLPEQPPEVPEMPLQTGSTPPLPAQTQTAQTALPEPAATLPDQPAGPRLPLWFVVLISVVNLGLAGFVWWIFKPAPLDLAPTA